MALAAALLLLAGCGGSNKPSTAPGLGGDRRSDGPPQYGGCAYYRRQRKGV